MTDEEFLSLKNSIKDMFQEISNIRKDSIVLETDVTILAYEVSNLLDDVNKLKQEVNICQKTKI